MSRRAARERRAEGTIEIEGLRCRGGHLVDIAARADLAPAIASDDLAHATDIAALAATVRAAIASAGRATALRMATGAARAILDRFPEVTAARVRVVRPGAVGEAEAASVEIELAR